MNLDLNKAQDFAKLTLSQASSALQLLTGLSGDAWDIEEGSYGHPESSGMVVFHVFKSSVDYGGAVSNIEDSAGRRKVTFEFPYVDGQTTDDLGRKGKSFDIDVLIFGQNYKRAFDRLEKELDDPKPGTLIHPIRGRLTCVADSWTITHSSEKRQAVALRIRFIEHNFNVTFERKQNTSPTTKGLISFAATVLGKINSVITYIDSVQNVAQIVKNQLTASVQTYSDTYQTTLIQMNATFNKGSTSDITALLPVNSTGTPSIFPVATSATSVFAGIPMDQIQESTFQAVAAQQAIDTVKAMRLVLNDTLTLLSDSENGQGALIFRDQIVTLKESSASMQAVLESGLQSSRARILVYTVPRIMSIREVCFANGLSPDRSTEIELLNPDLLSSNLVEAGSQLKVPTQ